MCVEALCCCTPSSGSIRSGGYRTRKEYEEEEGDGLFTHVANAARIINQHA